MKQPGNPKRRKLLAGLGAGGAGVVAAALAAGRTGVAAQAGTDPAQAHADQGYRLTEHVRSYYRTAGI